MKYIDNALNLKKVTHTFMENISAKIVKTMIRLNFVCKSIQHVGDFK